MQKQTNLITIVLLVSTSLGVGFCLYRITQSPTANEALLLSLFMTILSIMASWVVSRYYAKISYEDSLKVFARKAAEKVTNLSSELDRLSSFLQKALDEEDFTSPTEELLAKSIRFEDAIHLITALKSVNDTSLSDWKGIIGDELQAQRKAQIEEEADREERLRELIQHLEEVEHDSGESTALLEQQERERVRAELTGLRAEIRSLASGFGAFPLKVSSKRKTVERPCPHCEHMIAIMHGKAAATKKVTCPECKSSLYSQWDGTDVQLRTRKLLTESPACVVCSAPSIIELDPLYGANTAYECSQCHSLLRAIRSKSGLIVRLREESTKDDVKSGFSALSDFPEKRLREIATLMGDQPWPPGRSAEVRAKLGLRRQVVDYAIKRLIADGVFKPQIDGVLYEPIPASTSKS